MMLQKHGQHDRRLQRNTSRAVAQTRKLAMDNAVAFLAAFQQCMSLKSSIALYP